MADILDKLSGATGRFFDQKDVIMFKPYKSVTDGLYRTASVVAAPVIYTGFAAVSVIIAAKELLHSLLELCKGNVGGAKKHLAEAGTFVLSTVVTLLAAIVSPAVNAIDAVGSCVTSLKGNKNESSFVPLQESAEHDVDVEELSSSSLSAV